MAERDDGALDPAWPFASEERVRARHYRARAEEIRTIAEGMTDAECRDVLLYLARSYDGMAERAEAASQRYAAMAELIQTAKAEG